MELDPPPKQIFPLPPSVAAVGMVPIASSKLSLAGPQGPAGSLLVSVRITRPEITSAGLGEYVVVSDAGLPKLPVPDVDHVPLAAPPPTVPLTVIDGVIAQILWSAPAFAVAAGLMVRIKASETHPHGPAGSSVAAEIVTVPAAMSAALGVYVVVGAQTSANVPEPEVIHVCEVADPPRVAVTERVPVEQIV
jgi:hypothetical protein